MESPTAAAGDLLVSGGTHTSPSCQVLPGGTGTSLSEPPQQQALACCAQGRLKYQTDSMLKFFWLSWISKTYYQLGRLFYMADTWGQTSSW